MGRAKASERRQCRRFAETIQPAQEEERFFSFLSFFQI